MKTKQQYITEISLAQKAKKFQDLKWTHQLPALFKTEPLRLNYHLNKPIYFNFQIPKKNGGLREIQSPNEELKEIQNKLNKYLSAIYFGVKPKSVHGFVLGLGSEGESFSIVSNAKEHCNKKHVLNMDIENFFSSISAKQIKAALSKQPFAISEEISIVVALLGTYQKKLPTGAPSSPVLSNIYCFEMDNLLEEYCSTNELTYTRYADDLTFSSNTKISERVIDELRIIITNFGFKLNEKKFRLQSSRSKQTVTGLVVNKKVNVDRRYIRKLRAILYSWEKMGAEIAAAKHFNATKLSVEDVQKFVRKLAGQIQFVGQVRGIEDEIYRKLLLSFEYNMSLE